MSKNVKSMKSQAAAAIIAAVLCASVVAQAAPARPASTRAAGAQAEMEDVDPAYGAPRGERVVVVRVDPMVQWCQDSLAALQIAREQAMVALSKLHYRAARDILAQGLRNAQSDGYAGAPNGPLTARAIKRGIRISEAVNSAVEGAPNGLKTSVHFMLSYYAFVEKVAREVDFPAYIPYYHHGRCEDCGAVDPETFENLFVQYARDELSQVLEHLASEDGDHVFPLGNAAGFLKALELTASFAAWDLRSSLWAARYACAIERLSGLSARLQSYNAGATAFFNSDYEAVNSAYREAQDLVSRIEPSFGCNGGYRDGWRRW